MIPVPSLPGSPSYVLLGHLGSEKWTPPTKRGLVFQWTLGRLAVPYTGTRGPSKVSCECAFHRPCRPLMSSNFRITWGLDLGWPWGPQLALNAPSVAGPSL